MSCTWVIIVSIGAIDRIDKIRSNVLVVILLDPSLGEGSSIGVGWSLVCRGYLRHDSGRKIEKKKPEVVI